MGFLLFRRKESEMLKTESAGGPRRRIRRKNPLKLTALLYLREALQREQYERCAELIRSAEELGAAPYEIQDLLEDPRRRPG
jgi:hypothetical protein